MTRIVEVDTFATIPSYVPFGVLYCTQDTGALYIGTGNSTGAAVNSLTGGARTGLLSYVIDGAGVPPSTGVKGQVSIPVACTVTGWVITADQSGSAVVDILRSTYAAFPTTASIAGSDKPTLSSAQKNQNLGPLSGWGSTALAAGDQLQFSLSSVTSCTRLNVSLNITIP